MLQASLTELRTGVGWPADYLGLLSILEIGSRSRAIGESISRAPAWAAFEGIQWRWPVVGRRESPYLLAHEPRNSAQSIIIIGTTSCGSCSLGLTTR